jgi:nickel-dependent lactate racemase
LAQTIKLPQYAWYEPREVEFKLPDKWQVAVHNIAGYKIPALGAEEIKAAIASPIGMPPLREMARGKKEVVIIFDDMTRSTQVSEMAHPVLEELAAAGITDDRIRFIAAVANHHALDWTCTVKKLGRDIVARFPVYNHCPFLNCTDIGTSSYGTKVSVNTEVMNCDLKIAIGSIVPHPIYGLSGGGKMIMPGVSSYESVLIHHGRTHKHWREGQRNAGLPTGDVLDDNPFHADALEIAGMVGLDMVINCTVNTWGQIARVFAGALGSAYEAAFKEARKHYVAANTRDNDIVIANNFIKASEFMVPLGAAGRALKPSGGSIVILSSSPSGQVVHYLMDDFGKTIAGDFFSKIVVPPSIKNLVLYNEYPEAKLYSRFQEPSRIIQTDDWDRVLDILEKAHGENARVAVYPNSDIQIYSG